MYPVLIFLIAFIIVYIYSNRKITPIGVLVVFLITIIISSIIGCLYFTSYKIENFSNDNIHSPEDNNNSIWNKYDREDNDEEGDIFEYATNMSDSKNKNSTTLKPNTKSNDSSTNIRTPAGLLIKQNNKPPVDNSKIPSTFKNNQGTFDLGKFNREFEKQFDEEDSIDNMKQKENNTQNGYNMLKPLMQEEVDFEQTNNRKKMDSAQKSNNLGLGNRLFDNALNNNSIDIDPDNQNVNINVVYNINDELENKIKNIDRKLSLIGQADAEILRELEYIDEQNQGNYQQVNSNVNIGEEVENGGIPSTSWLRRLHPNFQRAPETVKDINAITTRGRRTDRNNSSEVNSRFQARKEQDIMLSKIRNDNENNNNNINNKQVSDSSIYGFTYTDPKSWPILNKNFNPNLLEKSTGVRPIKQGSYFKIE